MIRGTPPFAGEGLGEDSNSGNFLNKFAVLRSRTRVLPPPTRCLNVPFAVTVFIWKDSRAEFPDCLIGMRHLELGCQATATFDQRATKPNSAIAVCREFTPVSSLSFVVAATTSRHRILTQ